MSNAVAQIPRHVEVAYKDAVDNIMLNKSQQWLATNYAVLVYAAIFVTSVTVFSRTDMARALLGVLTLLTFLYHLYVLMLLQNAITSFRSRLAWIYRTYFTAEEQAGLNLLFEPKPYLYQAGVLLGLVAVSAIGAAMTAIYLFSVR